MNKNKSLANREINVKKKASIAFLPWIPNQFFGAALCCHGPSFCLGPGLKTIVQIEYKDTEMK